MTDALHGDLAKSHVKGYTRSDGVFVQPHNDKRRVAYHVSSGGEKTSGAAYEFVGQAGNDVDLIVWHGTAAEHLDAILQHGITPSGSVHKRSRNSDRGKAFIAANKKDAKVFAAHALKHAKEAGAESPAAVLLVIRAPAEARDRIDWGENGVETFANVHGGVPPEWIVGYQMISGDGPGSYTSLRKSFDDDVDGDAYGVVVFDGGVGDADLAKAHVKGHMRGQHYVRPYDRGDAVPLPPHHHPKLGEKGEQVLVKAPHHPSAEATWDNADAVATFVPGGDVPRELNGVPFRRWRDAPTTAEGWDYCDGVNDDLDEPAFHVTPGKSVASGVVIEEKDGRVWLIHPTNAYGGYEASFPKGGVEKGMSLQASACKEAWEESGLKVRITGFLMDVERTTSKARFYRAVRVGGDPTDCGWESEAVSLVPRSHLYDLLNMHTDHGIAEAVGAGPAPKKPEPPPGKWSGSKSLF